MEDRPFSDTSYEAFLSEEKLMGSQCTACGAQYVPPRPICIQCYTSGMKWVEKKGTGRLAAFTCISVAPPRMIAQGYHRKKPYVSGVVELDDGGRVDARIEVEDPNQPEQIMVGMTLKVKYLHTVLDGSRETFLAFEKAGP